MINTIFYFVPTLQEYQAKYNGGEIASRTIVFVEDNRSIYKDGIRYGGYNQQELEDIIDSKLDPLTINVQHALDLIDQLNVSIDHFIEDKKQDLKDVVDGVFSEYTWLRKNLGDMFAEHSFVEELGGFLSAIGFISESDARWSSIVQTAQSLTLRVAAIEQGQVDGTMLQTIIQSWISDGTSHLHLETYALKTDLADYLKTNDLNNRLTGTNAFIELSSNLGEAMAAIGAWSQTFNDTDITQLLSLLQQDVNSLTNTVTTTLSSTIRNYLSDDLERAVNLYLSNQAGLILQGDLDRAVANLFAQSTKSQTEDAVDGVVQQLTAGFIAETDLGTGTAAATVYATNGDLVASITAGIIDNMSNPDPTNQGQSFINAIADKFNVHGTLNIVNSNDENVAYIDKNGHASFINGHIYIPYYVTNWNTMSQEEGVVGLYVDSVARDAYNPSNQSYDTTYATAHWSSIFHPRVLIEPDGLLFENSNKARTGVVKSGVAYREDITTHNQIDTYTLSVRAYDPQQDHDNNIVDKSFCGLTMEPSLDRSGHESAGGYLRIENHKTGDTDNDPSTWTGKLHVTQFNSIEMEASNEFVFRGYGNGVNIGLHGKVSIIDDATYNTNQTFYYFDPAINSTWQTASDERIKTIVSNIDLSVEDIAATRLVNFKYKNSPSEVIHVGTIAQDWQKILPNVVSENDGILSVSYDLIATAASITAAREIVKLKQENEDLKKRLAAIEAKLGIA